MYLKISSLCMHGCSNYTQCIDSNSKINKINSYTCITNEME